MLLYPRKESIVSTVLLLLWTDGMAVLVRAQEKATTSASSSSSKDFAICSITGGVALAREASRSIQNLFLNALEDVEYMREILTETMTHLPNHFQPTTIEQLANTLDWENRGFAEGTTTLEANLAYVDDRPNRRVELLVGLAGTPPAGDKAADLAMVDILSGSLPWMVDRRSPEDQWWKPHSSLGHREDWLFDRLYLAAYAVTWGNAAVYYPPATAFIPPGMAFTLNDVLGPNPDFRADGAVQPALPENNPQRLAVLGTPYADRANPGLSIVSAVAPIYYTGTWQGFDDYNDTHLGLTGIDISIQSISSLLHQLDGTLSENSFGMVVDGQFNVYVITQRAVELIYPPRTGFQEFWVHRDESGQGKVVEDRRNQTYLVSDTILQSPTNLTNAKWNELREEVSQQPPGHKGFTTLDIVLTARAEEKKATQFYVMYDKWSTVGDLTLLVFAPQEQIDLAIRCGFHQSTTELVLETLDGIDAFGKIVFENTGILDIRVTLKSMPHWISLAMLDGDEDDTQNTKQLNDLNNGKAVSLPALGEPLVLPFVATTESLPIGLTSSLLTLSVQDDDYPVCFYSQLYSATISIQVQKEEDLQQLETFRVYGFVIGGIVIMTSILLSIWVQVNSTNAIVRASQPIFLHLLSFGTLVLGVSILPLAVDDSLVSEAACTKACMAFPWLFFLGFSITFAASFSKVYRIHQLMTAASSFQRQKITSKDVMMPLCAIMTCNIALLLFWTIADPLVWTRVEQEGENVSYGTCWYNMSTIQTTALALLTVVNLSALVLANVAAYRAKDIADEFSESKYIFLANFGMLQVMMIGIPVMFLVAENSRAFFFVRASLIFAIAWPFQLLIFLPKLWGVWKYSDGQSRDLVARAVKQSATNISSSKSSSLRPKEFHNVMVADNINPSNDSSTKELPRSNVADNNIAPASGRPPPGNMPQHE